MNSEKTIILGIDEAGRGPVIGSMFMVGFALPQNDMEKLTTLGVRDSKKISPGKREKIYNDLQKLESNIYIREISAREIDKALDDPSDNLNLLEIRNMAGIINEAQANVVIIDAISTPEYTKRNLKPQITKRKPILKVENKADDSYPIVGAASIIAKVLRDNSLFTLKKNFPEFGDFGSGYPSDPQTKNYLKKNVKAIKQKKIPFIRMEWDNVKKMILKKRQIRLLVDD